MCIQSPFIEKAPLLSKGAGMAKEEIHLYIDLK
jgi:hypothetical protein